MNGRQRLRIDDLQRGNCVARFAGSGSLFNQIPSAKALGYYHFVRFADDQESHPNCLGKAARFRFGH